MSKLIAVAGKGGTGKTTIAALAIKYLLSKGKTPILVVDADPNYTLGEALGIEVEQTIGMLREDFFDERANIPAGMTKEAVLQRQLNIALHEGRDIDLLVMGRQEGPGCYCYLNNVLRNFLDILSDDYPYVVVDNEAGMEHLSRRTTRNVDILFIVCDHSVKAARAAGRISTIADELDIKVKKRYAVLNRTPDEVAPEVLAEIKRFDLELLVTIPVDPEIANADARGDSLVGLSDSISSYQAVIGAIEKVL